MFEKAQEDWCRAADKAPPDQAENAGKPLKVGLRPPPLASGPAPDMMPGWRGSGAQSVPRCARRPKPSARSTRPLAKAPGNFGIDGFEAGMVIALRMPAAKSGQASSPATRTSKMDARCADDSFDRVLALVSRQTGVPISLLRHRSRCRAPIARARQLAMYLMNTSLGRTMTDIGVYLGRDRTTVAYACGRVEDWRDDKDFDEEVTALETAIGGPVEIATKAVRSDD